MNYQDEIDEAVAAAQGAIDALNEAEDALESASGWGMVDMFGGGLFTTMAKHSKMDEAQRLISKAQSAIYRFKDELSDVGKNLDIELDTDGFLTFADYFFDGFASDFLVQGQIEDARSKVRNAIMDIEKIKKELLDL